MKRTVKALLILFLVFLGISLGSKNVTPYDNFNERKDKFEDEIIIPDNNYDGYQGSIKMEPGIINNVGKKVEKGIDYVFDKTFKFILKFLE